MIKYIEEKNTNLQMESKILALDHLLNQKEDVEGQLVEANQVIDQHKVSKSKTENDFDSCSDYILLLEEKVFKANKTSLELLKQLKDAELELQQLKDQIIELKSKIAVYIPVKQDNIDKKLAEYINNYPERTKLKILFMRESSGIY